MMENVITLLLRGNPSTLLGLRNSTKLNRATSSTHVKYNNDVSRNQRETYSF